MKIFDKLRFETALCASIIIFFTSAKGEESGKQPTRTDTNSVSDTNEQKKRETTKAETAEELKVVTGPKGWALGCPAILMERNHSRHDTLATEPINLKTKRAVRQLLDEWWDVKTKGDLLDTLRWLETEGHRRGFDELVSKTATLDEQRYKRIEEMRSDDREASNELRIARKYGKSLGKKSILAWDYCRYIALCRWGYTAGMLSEEDAWNRIMPKARKLQKTFDSWEELGCNYLTGLQFWSYQRTVEEGKICEEAMQQLMDMTSSPWNKYPWNMNLDEADTNETGRN